MKEILIRLEDELFEQCKTTELTGKNEGFDFHIIKTVANGTVLSKGHGRLIDKDHMIARLEAASKFFSGEHTDAFDERFSQGLKEAAIKVAEEPTIIEADKENKE